MKTMCLVSCCSKLSSKSSTPSPVTADRQTTDSRPAATFRTCNARETCGHGPCCCQELMVYWCWAPTMSGSVTRSSLFQIVMRGMSAAPISSNT